MTLSSATAPSPAPSAAPRPARAIVLRTRGNTHGPITRLMSPGDIGELLKPFVFLDLFSLQPGGFGGFGWHLHSGIATVSVILEGSTTYEETTGAKGVLGAGAVECMRAGGGVWHTGGLSGKDRVLGYQLWVALPAEQEQAPAVSHYLQHEAVPAEGPYRVVLGSYGSAHSPITTLTGMNYLVVDLKDGEHWAYQPPAGHTVAWLAVHGGKVLTPEPVSRGELVVFEGSNGTLNLVAEGPTSFVLGSAIPHPHELVLGRYSVHTSPAALAQGEAKIMDILRGDAALQRALR